MSRTWNIAVLPGDGIGPEIMEQATRVFQQVSQDLDDQWNLHYASIGGAAIDKFGEPLPEETLALCQESDAVLLGAVGGPKWDEYSPELRPEKALLGLRKELGLYANLRPVSRIPGLESSSPLRFEVITNVDLLVVRELTGGIYFGEKRRTKNDRGEVASDLLIYHEYEIERIIREAFSMAQKRRKHLTSVDKANVLESSRLWRSVVNRIAPEYPDVEVQHMLVDNCAMQLVCQPSSFDVLVTENMFGDILSDEAAVLTGSIGLLPSASLGEGTMGLYEPIHGSAPDIAGKEIANPAATILSVAMMLRYSFDQQQAAERIEAAVSQVLQQGIGTADLSQTSKQQVSTVEFGDHVLRALNQ